MSNTQWSRPKCYLVVLLGCWTVFVCSCTGERVLLHLEFIVVGSCCTLFVFSVIVGFCWAFVWSLVCCVVSVRPELSSGELSCEVEQICRWSWWSCWEVGQLSVLVCLVPQSWQLYDFPLKDSFPHTSLDVHKDPGISVAFTSLCSVRKICWRPLSMCWLKLYGFCAIAAIFPKGSRKLPSSSSNISRLLWIVIKRRLEFCIFPRLLWRCKCSLFWSLCA